MDPVQFIYVNFWPLIALCVVVFILGFVLWMIGSAMQREGERRLAAIHRTQHVQEPEFRAAPKYVYPPVEDYDPVPDFHRPGR